MKIIVISPFILLSCFLYGDTPDEYKTRIKIDLPVHVKAIDVSKKLDPFKVLKLTSDIKKLVEGERGKGLIEYKHEYYTLEQLVRLEQQLVEKNDAKTLKQFHKSALHEALKKFTEISHEYLKEGRGFKRQMVALISKWAEQRQQQQSALLDWGNLSDNQEMSHMNHMIESCQSLEKFLADLSCFLKDLLYSCENTYTKFMEWRKSQQQLKGI